MPQETNCDCSTNPISIPPHLTNDIVALATRYGRYGYRWITVMLRLLP